jgi:hypothetical protein
MKKCAVMQPSYLPWVGYFNLIMNSDVFIFLDDVQYSKNTYFNRNRYPTKNTDGFAWLTLPVRRVKSTQLFTESCLVEEDNWRKKHLTTLQHVYGKTEFFAAFYPFLEKEILDLSKATLAEINIGLIKSICAYLEIEKEFYLSSELNISGSRSERLLSFCKRFDCQIYLSPVGAREYIDEDNILPPSEVKVLYQNYVCKEYQQKSAESFLPYMSIVDLLFQNGKEFSKENIFQII